MTVFKTFDDLVYHNKIFNIIFTTTLTSVLAATLIGLLALWGFFTNWFTIIVLVTIVAAPIIIFISMYTNPDIKTAYYKTWRDIFQGRIDQRKILKQFARTYGIKSWRRKIEKIEVDGRWHFHADTNYIKKMSNEQDFTITQLHQEYCNRSLELDKRIIAEKKNLASQKIYKDERSNRQSEADDLLKKAKSSREVYVQRRILKHEIHESNNAEQGIAEIEANLKMLEAERATLQHQYQKTAHLIKKFYQNRYMKYAESAVKKINRVNNLKYDIMELSDS